ncbi:MAG: DUF6491 family protein [Steroidobacteraceae bacterium]
MKQSKAFRILGLLVGTSLLASCATLQRQDATEHARFDTYAGKPVAQFTWLTSQHGASAISRNQLVAWTDINRPYLITVVQPCPDLMLANGIAITSTIDTVHAHADYVIARGFHCEISTIQPIDYLAMRRAIRPE